MRSFSKKINTLIKEGIDPLQDGVINFNNEIPSIEALAKKRAEVCIACPEFVDEPIGFLALQDLRIPEMSKKMCNECGCTLPYKIRQSKIKCNKWRE